LAERSADIDRLRSLGYADVSTEVFDEEVSGVVLHDPELSAPGNNLYVNRARCTAHLMDGTGRELRRWSRPGDLYWSDAQLLPGGDLLVIGRGPTEENLGVLDEHRFLLRLAADGEERWEVKLNAHHDWDLTPAGELAVLCFRRLREPGLEMGLELREDTIALLDLEGHLLEERSLEDKRS
jgi:hypothetical protein